MCLADEVKSLDATNSNAVKYSDLNDSTYENFKTRNWPIVSR